jgi:hypothetical protein
MSLVVKAALVVSLTPALMLLANLLNAFALKWGCFPTAVERFFVKCQVRQQAREKCPPF